MYEGSEFASHRDGPIRERLFAIFVYGLQWILHLFEPQYGVDVEIVTLIRSPNGVLFRR